MRGKRGYTLDQVISAIKDSGGVISTIARRLNCEWHTAKKYIEKWESAKMYYQDEKEHILDLAESTIILAIKNGDIAAAKYYLSKMGRERGYGDEISVNQTARVIVEEIPVGKEDKEN